MSTHFSGMVFGGGIPLTGGLPISTNGYKVFFVDPINGAAGNDGSSEHPMDSISTAYAACTSGRGDVVCLVGGPGADGGSAMTNRLSAAFDWAKDNTHLIGLAAPTRVGQRSRITGPSSGGTFSPMFTVSGDGCRFANITLYDDYTVDPCALKVTGQRNYFYNVNVQGMAAATGADDANGSSLWIAGGAENTFESCTIGLDTTPRSTTNGEIRLTSQATRNIFIDCDIVSYCDNAGHLWVKASSTSDLDRYTTFQRCRFHNAPTGIASGTTMTQGMNVASDAGGYILLDSCVQVGATDWCAADNGNVFIGNAAPTAGTSGIAVAVTR